MRPVSFCRIRPTVFAMSMAAAFAGFSAPASALLITAESSASGSGLPLVSSNSDAGFAASNIGAYEANGEASANAWGSAAGAYAVTSYAQGASDSNGLISGTGSVSFESTITNTLGVAAALQYKFYIYGGYVSTGSGALGAGEYLSSSYAASVSAGGSQVWNSSAQIVKDESGTTFSTSGAALSADDGSDGYYGWSGQFFTIDLGVLAAGASLDLDVDISASSASKVGDYNYCGGGGYNGYGGYSGYGSASCLYTGAFYGDPSEFGFVEGQFELILVPTTSGGGSSSSSSSGGSNVPAPSVLALLGIGLLASSLARRIKRSA